MVFTTHITATGLSNSHDFIFDKDLLEPQCLSIGQWWAQPLFIITPKQESGLAKNSESVSHAAVLFSDQSQTMMRRPKSIPVGGFNLLTDSGKLLTLAESWPNWPLHRGLEENIIIHLAGADGKPLKKNSNSKLDQYSLTLRLVQTEL